MLYHISKDIALNEKVFIPRVPKLRLINENRIIKRVCVSGSIENCISSFPYKKDIIVQLTKGLPAYLSVYKVDEQLLASENLMKPDKVIEYVDDAELKREHWILKEFTRSPSLIRIRKLKLSRYYKHTNSHSGEVAELEFEKEIEDYDRFEKAIFYNRDFYKEFLRVCRECGIEIKQVRKNKEHMEYFGIIESSRKYEVHRITYKIPSGISAKGIWFVISKELHKYRRKCLIFDKNDYV